MRLYVGNLSREVSESDLMDAFQVFGKVNQVTIVRDRSQKVSKGFGFVEMPEDEEARKAIAGLHLQEMKGQSMDITEERPRKSRKPGRSGGGGGGRGNRKGKGGRRRSW